MSRAAWAIRELGRRLRASAARACTAVARTLAGDRPPPSSSTTTAMRVPRGSTRTQSLPVSFLPAARRTSGISMPWSMALRTRCCSGSFSASRMRRSSRTSPPVMNSSTCLPRRELTSRTVRRSGSSTWTAGTMRMSRRSSRTTWATRLSCSPSRVPSFEQLHQPLLDAAQVEHARAQRLQRLAAARQGQVRRRSAPGGRSRRACCRADPAATSVRRICRARPEMRCSTWSPSDSSVFTETRTA